MRDTPANPEREAVVLRTETILLVEPNLFGGTLVTFRQLVVGPQGILSNTKAAVIDVPKDADSERAQGWLGVCADFVEVGDLRHAIECIECWAEDIEAEAD